MRIIKFTIAFFILSVTGLFAQPGSTFWMSTFGDNDADEAMSVCKTSNGDIISAGYFTNTVYFNQGITLTSTSAGTPDVFIMKQNAAGAVQWVTKAGGNGSDRALSVKCNSNGDIFITGFYYGQAIFGSTTLNS
jgi:hypothetical protein